MRPDLIDHDAPARRRPARLPAAMTTLAGFLAVVAPMTPARADGPDDGRIVQLIEQLGDDRFATREAAQKELVQIGLPAVDALQAARTSPDPEVAYRAGRCLAEIDVAIELKRTEHRTGAEAAVKRSDRAEAARHYRALLALPEPTLLDCRKASELFGANADWESFAAAQEMTAEVMRRIINTPVKEFTRPAPPPANLGEGRRGGPTVLVQTNLDGVWSNCRGDAEHWFDWLTRKQNDMKRDRLNHLVQLGRTYRDTLGRPDKAVAALKNALAEVEFCSAPIDQVIAKSWPPRSGTGHPEIAGSDGSIYVNTLRELSETQQQAGDLDGAIETKTRQLLAHFILCWDHRQKVFDRPAFELASLLRSLPADAPLPPLFWVNVLDPENPRVELDLSGGGPLELHDMNVLARPGYVFNSLEVTADVEWTSREGRLSCYTVLEKHDVLGTLRWEHKKQGRQELTGTFDVPPEAGLVRFETQPWEIERLQVRRIAVSATFRSAASKEPPGSTP